MDIPRYILIFGMCFILTTDITCQPADKPSTADEKDGQYFSSLKPLIISMFNVQTYSINVSFPCQEIEQYYVITAESANKLVFRIHSNRSFIVRCSVQYNVTRNESAVTYDSGTTEHETLQSEELDHVRSNGSIAAEITLTLEGKLLGISNLVLRLDKSVQFDADETLSNNVYNNSIAIGQYHVHSNNYDVSSDDVTSENLQTFKVLVLRILRPVDKIFMVFVPIFLFAVTVGFGCKLDLGIVKECVKKPVAPGIGLSCQYVIMPLIGFTVAKLLPNIDDGIALGIFVCGICPGGGVSNIYTYLLDGDVSLSITMTFLSTVVSIVMMPLWLYTLGTLFITEEFNVSIPWTNLIQIIALVTVPLFLGIFLKHKFIKVALFIIKALKPVTICAVIVLTVFAFYSNWYIFKLFTPLHILAGCLLPYLGYIFGGVIAALFKQPVPRIKAIILETGMQNVGVAYILMISSLPPPHGDLASVAPMASAVMTPIPAFIITIIYLIYKKCFKKYEPLNVENPEITVKTEDYVDEDSHSMLPGKLSTVERETIL